jgi:YgiT-type zinc finger domain-containing protein
MDIKHCPSCGSNRIRKVCGSLLREFKGQTYTVSGLTCHECPDCGERAYEREAVRKIQAQSPAFQGELTAR